MSSTNGFIFRVSQAIALFLLLLLPQKTECQAGILDSIFTFRAGSVKTSGALDIITGRTGYSFTYDSRLIDGERPVDMNLGPVKLEVILDSILKNKNLVFLSYR